jgi:TetR/AcrR family transcriptional regulator, transcriptional repressor for nem operon
MPRPKQFDPQQALAKAMRVFWRFGYGNTSTELLLREMGIAKQSLYDTFGGKRALYLQALRYYRRETNTALDQLLSSTKSVKQGFAKTLLGIAAQSREQHERGCLLLSANLERDTSDSEITALLRENQTEVEAIFLRALRRAQKQGELSPNADPVALSRFFVVTIQGLRALARLKSDRQTLRQVAEVALRVFE